MADALREEIRPLYAAGKVPIVLGGDHACSPDRSRRTPIPLRAWGSSTSTPTWTFGRATSATGGATGARHARILEKVGARNIVVMGVRSVSAEEMDDNKSIGMSYITAHEIAREGIELSSPARPQHAQDQPAVHLPDIDAIDPAYAGGTGTPEPFGLTPRDVKYVIDQAAPRLAGLDIMEVSPHYDTGNTSALAARLARESIVRRAAALGRT